MQVRGSLAESLLAHGLLSDNITGRLDAASRGLRTDHAFHHAASLRQLMKITAIKTLVCNARMRNWIFVKVETDQPGLIGWGEATLEWHTRSIVGAVEDL